MLSYTVTVLVSLIVAWPMARLSAKRPDVAVAVLIGVVCFSSYVFALVYRVGLPAEIVRGLIPVKDVLAVVTVATVAWVARPLPRTVLAPIAAVLILVALGSLAGLIRGLPLQDVLFSARGMVIAPLGLSLGLLLGAGERVRASRTGAMIVAVAAAVALVEYVLPWSFVTDFLQVGKYWADVKGQPQFLVQIPGAGLLPGNATMDPYTAGAARRLMGPFGDPLSAGVVLAAGLVWTIGNTRKSRGKLPMALVIALALALTLTRAGWILAAVTIVPMVVHRHSQSMRRLSGWASRGRTYLAAFGLVLFVAGALALIPPTRSYIVAQLTGSSSSTSGHLAALFHLRNNGYSLLGGGVGSSGAVVGAGTESSAATVVLEIGIVGGLAYLILNAILVWRARERWVPMLSFLGLAVAVLISWAVSEEWLTYNAGLTYGLLIALGGGLVRTSQRSSSLACDAPAPQNAAGRQELE